MTKAEKAQMKLNSIYAALAVMGTNSTSMKGKRRPTTEKVLAEAKKISEWVLPMEGDER